MPLARFAAISVLLCNESRLLEFVALSLVVALWEFADWPRWALKNRLICLQSEVIAI
jgi:hypothetical protein